MGPFFQLNKIGSTLGIISNIISRDINQSATAAGNIVMSSVVRSSVVPDK